MDCRAYSPQSRRLIVAGILIAMGALLFAIVQNL
jgi:hypothetical protein